MSGTKPKPMYWLAAVILLSVVASVAHIVAVVTQHWYLVKCTVREDLATPATWHFHVTLWGGHCALGASQDNATRYTCVNLEALLGDGEGGGDDEPAWVGGARFSLGGGVGATILATVMATFLYVARTSLTRQVAVGLAGVLMAAGSFSIVGLLCLQSGSFQLNHALSQRCGSVVIRAAPSCLLELCATSLLVVTAIVALLAGMGADLSEKSPAKGVQQGSTPQPCKPVGIDNATCTSEV